MLRIDRLNWGGKIAANDELCFVCILPFTTRLLNPYILQENKPSRGRYFQNTLNLQTTLIIFKSFTFNNNKKNSYFFFSPYLQMNPEILWYKQFNGNKFPVGENFEKEFCFFLNRFVMF